MPLRHDVLEKRVDDLRKAAGEAGPHHTRTGLAFLAINAIIDIARNLNRIAEMSGEKPLRKVVILQRKSGEMTTDEAGLFHAWGVAGGNSVAIIETADGTTCAIDPAYVQFIKEKE